MFGLKDKQATAILEGISAMLDSTVALNKQVKKLLERIERLERQVQAADIGKKQDTLIKLFMDYAEQVIAMRKQ